MICAKCSALNDDGDRFCFRCGAPLSASAQTNGAGSSSGQSAQSGAGNQQPVVEDRLAISATTTLAAKKARIADVKGMRPLTQAAYNIVESDKGPIYTTLISLLNIVISLTIVAVIIETFETINLIVASSTSSMIEGSLMEHYQNAAGDNRMRLVWCVLLFVFLVMAFVFCGRLSIRINKVNRKRKRENLTARLD